MDAVARNRIIMRVLKMVAILVAAVAIGMIPFALEELGVISRATTAMIYGSFVCVMIIVVLALLCKSCYEVEHAQEMQHLMQEKSATYDRGSIASGHDRGSIASGHDRGSIASGHDVNGSTAINSTESNV